MGTCLRCDKETDTTTHTIWYFDDRDPEHVDVCGPCTRKIRNGDDNIRSIT